MYDTITHLASLCPPSPGGRIVALIRKNALPSVAAVLVATFAPPGHAGAPARVSNPPVLELVERKGGDESLVATAERIDDNWNRIKVWSAQRVNWANSEGRATGSAFDPSKAQERSNFGETVSQYVFRTFDDQFHKNIADEGVVEKLTPDEEKFVNSKIDGWMDELKAAVVELNEKSSALKETQRRRDGLLADYKSDSAPQIDKLGGEITGLTARIEVLQQEIDHKLAIMALTRLYMGAPKNFTGSWYDDRQTLVMIDQKRNKATGVLRGSAAHERAAGTMSGTVRGKRLSGVFANHEPTEGGEVRSSGTITLILTGDDTADVTMDGRMTYPGGTRGVHWKNVWKRSSR